MSILKVVMYFFQIGQEKEENMKSELATANKQQHYLEAIVAQDAKEKQDLNSTIEKLMGEDQAANKGEGNNDSDSEYEVKKILKVRIRRDNSKEFLIRWKGYTSEFDTWEPERNLTCDNLIQEYLRHRVNTLEATIDDDDSSHEDPKDDDENYKGQVDENVMTERRTCKRVTKRPAFLNYAHKLKCHECGASLSEDVFSNLGTVFCSQSCIEQFENYA